MGWKRHDSVVPGPPNFRIFSRFFLTVHRFLTSFLGFPHSPTVHGPPNSHIFSRFFLTRHSDHDIMLYLLFDWHLRSTGQFLIQSDHDTSILFVPGQLLVQSDHDTHIHVQSDIDMPYRILTYFLGFSWGICSSRDNFSRTSCPIRSRHLYPCPIR